MFKSVASTLLVAIAGAASAAGAEPRWYGIFAADGTRIGYASREVTERPDGREIVETHSVHVTEEGRPPTAISERRLVRQTRDGRTISVSEHAQNGRGWARTEAAITPGRAVVTRRTRWDSSTATVTLTDEVRFDGGEDLLAVWDPAATPRLEFQVFSLDSMAVERVTIEPARGAGRDAQGRLPVLRRSYLGSELRGVSRLLIGQGGEIVEIEQPMFGSTIRSTVVDRQTALRRPTPYSLLRAALVRAPYRVPASALQGRIRYRFAYRDGIEFPLPATGEQRATASDRGVTLEICSECGPGLATDPANLADALRSTVWLQSSDRRVRAIAEPVGRMSITGARKMELLTRQAQSHLPEIDFSGHFSAVETISRRAGDCTEAAVLLAALGRAAGIPTRVASGLVYSRERYHGVSNVFMPHSWVLAYVDGRWRSFDAALDAFDATHIALTIGDGDSRSIAAASQLAALLEWAEMSEVRSRPAR
ncbi:transglutaminase-like domain-containing protein [Allosphingosinicella sp.]|uniref:transglutaminase-like domain-containing protein n=1 Tax=Allosphingosinicella sp. TaxID=2823234 RepID=UPI002EDCF2E6